MTGRPSSTRPAVRWGLGDVVWVWFAGLFVGAVAGSIAAGLRGRGTGLDPDGLDLAIGLFAQNGAILVALAVLSRTRGLGSMRRDFGLVVRPRDWPWMVAGVFIQFVAFGMVLLLEQVAPDLPEQQAADTVARSQGPEIAIVVLGVVLLAPLVEELLFRGLLLRSLLRRFSPVVSVLVSAAVFSAVHLLDPSTASLMAPLLLLAVISGIRAVRSGELSQSILLHVGFNLVSAIFLVTT